MRFNEFKEDADNIDRTKPSAGASANDGDAGDAEAQAAQAAKTDQGLKSGPPYPPEDMNAVKSLQKSLEALGYSVGNTGIDGKYGPRTSRAVRAFKKDYKLQGDGLTFDKAAQDMLSKIGTGSVKKVVPAPIEKGTDGLEYSVSNSEIESIIRTEAELRGIDPDVAIEIYRYEGRGSYQSTVPRSGNGSLNGREASFGPYQLYIGGGLGNEYESNTGRELISDNTKEGITNQIRFALDAAVRQSWQPWYGRKNAGISQWQGLQGAKQAKNWR